MMTTLNRCVVACVALGLLVVPSLAQSGNGNGASNGDQECVQQQDQLQDCTLTIGSLTDTEIAHLFYMRQEEKLARDVYVTFEEWWQADVFARIAVSEQRHMDAVGRIITALELDDPVTSNEVGAFDDDGFAEMFETLTNDGSGSYVEALQTGAYIEELDILDLAECLEDVENEVLANVLQNLMRGSRNHLRAFTAYLAAEGVTYVPKLMDQDQYDAIVNSPVERGRGNGNGGRRGRGQGRGNGRCGQNGQ